MRLVVITYYIVKVLACAGLIGAGYFAHETGALPEVVTAAACMWLLCPLSMKVKR